METDMLSNRQQTRCIGALTAILMLAYSMQAFAGKPLKKPDGGDTGPSYAIVQLDDGDGTFTGGVGRDINGQRQIVGHVDDSLGGRLAACWTTSENGGEVQSELHLLTSGIVANGINELGEIVGAGFSGDQIVGLYWASKDAAPLVLPPLAGFDESGARAINDDGVICGASSRWAPRLDENGDPVLDQLGVPILDYATRAVAWRRITGTDTFRPIELPSLDFSDAAAINNNDAAGLAEIVGRDGRSAVVWTVLSAGGTLTAGPVPTVLNTRGHASSVNSSGTICGNLWTDDVPSEAVVWSGSSTQVLDRAKFVFSAWANDVNNAGQIVGEGDYWKNFTQGRRAVVWPSAGGSMILLNGFLDDNSPFTSLVEANTINDSGDIAGAGWDGNHYGAFLAIPN